MSTQGDGVAGMAEYDVAHIDLDQYRQLRALVLEGRAKARVIVDCLGEHSPSVFLHFTDRDQR